MKEQTHKCPICDAAMKCLDDFDSLSFSHSEEINELGWTKDCWFARWECPNGHYALEWFDDDPPTDFGEGACRTGEWSYYASEENHYGFRDTKGNLILDESYEIPDNTDPDEPISPVWSES